MEAIIKLLFTLWIISMIVELIFAVKFLHSRTHVAFYSGSYMEMQHDKWFQILRDALAMVVLPNMILFFCSPVACGQGYAGGDIFIRYSGFLLLYPRYTGFCIRRHHYGDLCTQTPN